MTPSERAKKIATDWFHQCGFPCAGDDLPTLEKMIDDALTVPDGHFRDEHGNDMRVLGTLPKTADGVCVVPGQDVWLFCPVNYSDPSEGYVEEHGVVQMYSHGEYAHSSFSRNQCWDLSRCYFSKEAAIAARNGKVK